MVFTLDSYVIDTTLSIEVNTLIVLSPCSAGIRPPLKPDRQAIVQRAFDIINRSHPGVLMLDDMREAYFVERHPKYCNGQWPRDKILKEVLKELMLGAERQDGLTKEEFFDYYTMLSANIEKDVYFDFLLRTTWKL